MLGWMKHRLESRMLGEISITSDDTTIMADREEEVKVRFRYAIKVQLVSV